MKIMQKDNYKLAGAWELENYLITNQRSENVFLWGPKAFGLLIYLNNSRMSVQVSNIARPFFAQDDFLAGSDTEVRSAFEGYTAYFGKYEYREEDGLVYHDVQESVFPNWRGVRHTRYVSLIQNKLILSTPPIMIKGMPCEMQMFWKKVD